MFGAADVTKVSRELESRLIDVIQTVLQVSQRLSQQKNISAAQSYGYYGH